MSENVKKPLSLDELLDAADRLRQNSPEDFGQFVGKILRKMARVEPIAYGYVSAALATHHLRSGGVFVALEQTKQALGDQQWDRVAERVTAIERWLRELEYLGSKERLQALLMEPEDVDCSTVKSSQTYVM